MSAKSGLGALLRPEDGVHFPASPLNMQYFFGLDHERISSLENTL